LYPPISNVLLATIPVALAALTVWMVRDALGKGGTTTPAAPSAVTVPAMTR